MPQLLPCILLILVTTSSHAVELVSTEQRTQLIELYTSEGCSSCPPADRWLSEFRQDPQLWVGIIPVALHVDYWDYIGWKDPFADGRFSQRQREYVAQGFVSGVYTPGFIVNGREWRGWFVSRGKPPRNVSDAGVLRLDTRQQVFDASYSKGGADRLHIVWLGFDVPSTVTAGENRGRSLSHDFIVLAHRSYAGDGTWQGALPPKPASKNRLALAAWVSRGDSPVPLQAVGGWYPQP
ncbi:MAG: DUF1223 domain-containing protein [Pseudomonadota bacterium]